MSDDQHSYWFPNHVACANSQKSSAPPNIKNHKHEGASSTSAESANLRGKIAGNIKVRKTDFTLPNLFAAQAALLDYASSASDSQL